MNPATTLLALALAGTAFAAEYHVAVTGDDAGGGSQSRPLKTIQAAANRGQPGDVITVHEGVYRERVNPPRGGTADKNRITYQAAPGEKVIISGYGDEWDNKSDTAPGYVETIKRALNNGWNKETVGSHLVRNNHIHHCEQAGIVGSLGCSFSRVTGNEIHDIHTHRLFDGSEQAGIKFHGAIDTEISGNHKLFNLPFENPDGSPLAVDTDFFGTPRNPQNPFPGPFEVLTDGKQTIKVWPK